MDKRHTYKDIINIVDVFDDCIEVKDGKRLIHIQDAFFDRFEEALFVQPMHINGELHAHFYVVKDNDEERILTFRGFIYGYLA